MNARQLLFAAPYQVTVQEIPLPPPPPGHMLVQTELSAISPGTEMLVYRGQLPQEMALDATIDALAGAPTYPLTYGYAAVGRVTALGEKVNPAWLGRRVFAFQPHASHFCAPPESLLSVPDGISPEQAAFLPNMESAVNFVMDGQPQLGEDVVLFGQGVVGLLTTALLARHPLGSLTVVDGIYERRQKGLALGATAQLDPLSPNWTQEVTRQFGEEGADLLFELSGNPAALDQAIAAAGFSARLVIGSWYGQKRADLNLGGPFHRKRLRLLSSQVSTVDPAHSGRWTKARRLALAWRFLAEIPVTQLITHRFPIAEAPAAYKLIDCQPEATVQILLIYP